MSQTSTDKLIFKEAFKGFNKEDVITFIGKLSADHLKELGEQTVQIERLQRQGIEDTLTISKLSARIEELEQALNASLEQQKPEESSGQAARVSELEAELINRDFQINELVCEADSLRTAIYEMQADKEAVVSGYEKEIEALSAKIYDLENPQEKESETIYDEISIKMGRMIFSAEQTAREAVQTANEKAAIILNDASLRSAEIVGAAEQQAQDTIADANARLENETAKNRVLLEKSRQELSMLQNTICELNSAAKSALDRSYAAYTEYDNKIRALLKQSRQDDTL